MARTARLYIMGDLAFLVVNKHANNGLAYKKSLVITMFQHWITQIKCDQKYIGSVSYLSLMVESVKQCCTSDDVSSNMQKIVKFHIWKEKQTFLHVGIKAYRLITAKNVF